MSSRWRRKTSLMEEDDSLNVPLSIVSENPQYSVPELDERKQDKRSAINSVHPESRPFSRASFGEPSVVGSWKSFNPFSRLKVEDLTNYAMNDQRWTLQRKKIGLKRYTTGTRENRIRNKQTKQINIEYILNNFKRKECNNYIRDYMRENIANKEVCKCGLTLKEHGAFNLGTSFPHGTKDQRSVFSGNFQNKTDKYIAQIMPEAKLQTISEVEKSQENGHKSGPKIPEILQADGIIARSRRDLQLKNQKEQQALLTSKDKKGHWSTDSSMKSYPTNAYGRIAFVNESSGSNKPAKYVRLSDESNMEAVVTLMTDYWRLHEPNYPCLVISVIGGAKNFRLDGKKKETFNQGLIRAVKSTNAWILSGGMNVGVTKSVGTAVNEGQHMVKTQHMVRGVKCIGVAPWGYVKDNSLLINQDPGDFPVVRYKVEGEAKMHQNVSLNGDHTHFLLVDNGIRNRYSGADQFRTELLKAIQEPEPVGLGIPGVLLILEGGITSIVECSLALKNNIPVVVVSNTGRAADIIAYGVSMTVQTPKGNYMLPKSLKKQLLAKVYSLMAELEPSACQRCVDLVVKCCSRANLITVFDINSNEGMDKYILYALLQGGVQDVQSNKVDQLNLSLLWNRPDIAESHIFPSYSEWPISALEDLMTTALLDEKVEFVCLLVMNGLIMSDYLTVGRLRRLYNDSSGVNTHIGRLLHICSKSHYYHLYHVHCLLEIMVRQHHDEIYLLDTPESFHDNPALSYTTFEDPYQELLLWAVLTSRGNLAAYLWERCNHPLSTATAACCINGSLWKSLGVKNTVLRDNYLEQKTRFEKLAVEFIQECNKDDPINAVGVVERRYKKWGDLDVIQLAILGNAMLIISSPCCQISVDFNWRRGMIRAPTVAVVISNVCPFLIWTQLFSFQKLGDKGGELNLWQKLLVFYKSPVSKFYGQSTAFVLFLMLYAYVVLFDFRPEMTGTEKFLVLWIGTYMLDEVNEAFQEDASILSGKISDWWSSVWNRFDVISYALATIALILRLNPTTFKYGRIAYALNTTVFYIRLFRIYHVSYNLGPKLVIFYRMISEVLIFMSLLIIFILGYGIASQALLHPWRTIGNTNMTTIITEVILTPYWQMYGELLLEKIEGSDAQRCPLVKSWNREICENPSEYTWVANMMLVFYLIIGNIMLLNLLIAIFTYVFDEVQENSMEIWKFEMCRLLKEYDAKPGLVPPFMILEHIYRIAKTVWKKFIRKKRENLEEFMKDTLNDISIFEKEAMLSFVARRKAKSNAATDNVIARISEKVDRITKYIHQEEELKEIEEDIKLATEMDSYDGGKRFSSKILEAQVVYNTETSSTESSDDDNRSRKTITLRPLTARNLRSSTATSRPFTAGRRKFLQDTSTAIENQQDQITALRKKLDTLQLNIKESQQATHVTLNEILYELTGKKKELPKVVVGWPSEDNVSDEEMTADLLGDDFDEYGLYALFKE